MRRHWLGKGVYITGHGCSTGRAPRTPLVWLEHQPLKSIGTTRWKGLGRCSYVGSARHDLLVPVPLFAHRPGRGLYLINPLARYMLLPLTCHLLPALPTDASYSLCCKTLGNTTCVNPSVPQPLHKHQLKGPHKFVNREPISPTQGTTQFVDCLVWTRGEAKGAWLGQAA